MSKKKVLYIITKSNFGGAQKYVIELATKLPKATYEAIVALGGNGELAMELRKQGIRVITIPGLERDLSLTKEISVFYFLLSLFKKEKPDIVHLNSSKIGGIGSLAGRIAGVPKIIFTAHGWAFNENRPFFSRAAIWILSWITTILCHKVVVLGNREFDQTLKMPGAQSRPRLIPLGIAPFDLFPPEAARTELLSNLPLQHRTIGGTIAELHPNKGLFYALKAIAKIQQETNNFNKFSYVIIGEGEQRKELEELIKKLKLDDCVFLTGAIPKANRLLRAFDFFLLPSIKEGLPYVLLEAGYAGLPVITTAVGNIPDLINNEKNGILIPPKNIAELSNAIKSLQNDPEKRNSLGEKLQKTIQQQFTFEKMLAKTINLYEEK